MASVIASQVSVVSQIVYAAFLIAVATFSLIFSILSLVTFARINRMFKFYRLHAVPFLINMALGDILFVGIHIVPSIVTALYAETWLFGTTFCQAQCILRYILAANTMHTMALVITERLVKLLRPIAHEKLFTPCSKCFLICSIWIIDIFIAILPFAKWSNFILTPHLFQCSVNWVASTSYQSFNFVLVFALPFIYTTILSIIILVKVERTLSNYGHRQGLTLQQPQQSYIIRLVRINISLAFSPIKKRNITISQEGKARYQSQILNPNEDGYGSDQSEDDEVVTRKVASRNDYSRKKKVYKFYRSDFITAVTYQIISTIYILSWMMYIGVNYHNSHNFVSNIPTTVWLIAVFLTHLSVLLKPIIYFSHNYKFRHALYYAARPWRFRIAKVDLINEKLNKNSKTIHVSTYNSTYTSKYSSEKTYRYGSQT